MATPPEERQPRTHQEFAKLLGVTTTELTHFEMEQGFEKAVLQCKMPLLRNVPRIVAAVLKNALDSSRTDQKMWMEFYLELAGLETASKGSVNL